MKKFDYKILRSGRKTLAIEIRPDATVLVRAPTGLAQHDILIFVEQQEQWILKKLELCSQAGSPPVYTTEELTALKLLAQHTLPQLTALWAQRMELTPAHIKITSARTRFGSCSGKNSLCFSCLLMLYPPAAIEYVVVHELAHIRHKNHSKAFYNLIGDYLPDHVQRRRLLREPAQSTDTVLKNMTSY